MKIFRQVEDWDDAYANRAHVDNADELLAEIERRAPLFREELAVGKGRVSLDLAYGETRRERYDLFEPEGEAKGLFMFVHGGYWMAFDKDSWSHMGAQALANGWAVAIPSYTLCPEIRIAQITQQIARAIEHAAERISGPIVLSGHSAGGHLVARMGTKETPLSVAVSARIKQIISISGVHDLRPIRRLALNDILHIDGPEALAESPVLLQPRQELAIACVGGSSERPEFIRQNALLANIWAGLGSKTVEISVEGKNHFDIIDELVEGNDGWLAEFLA